MGHPDFRDVCMFLALHGIRYCLFWNTGHLQGSRSRHSTFGILIFLINCIRNSTASSDERPIEKWSGHLVAMLLWGVTIYVFLFLLQGNKGTVVSHFPCHLGAEYPLVFALMERINVNFSKRQVIIKPFRKYFSIYIYTWVSLMFQEFIILRNKSQKTTTNHSVWFRRQWRAFQLCHLTPLFLPSPWGDRSARSL